MLLGGLRIFGNTSGNGTKVRHYSKYLRVFLFVSIFLWLLIIKVPVLSQNNIDFLIYNNAYSAGVVMPSVPLKNTCMKNIHVYLHNASVYYQKEQYDKAIKEYFKVLEEDPQNIIAHYNLGMIYYDRWINASDSYYEQLEARKFLNKSEEEFLWVKDNNPTISMVYFKLGRIYTIKGDIPNAISQYQDGIKVSPKNFVFYFNLASLYEDSGETDLAIAYYKDSIKLNKHYPHAYNNLALIYENKGYTEEAIKHYKKAIKLDKTYMYSYINLGSLYTNLKNYNKAHKYLSTALALEPNNPWVHMHMGNLYENENKLDLAVSEYLKFVELKPGYSKGYYLLCNLLSKMNKEPEALIVGMLYLKLDPEGQYSVDVQLIIKKIQNNIIKNQKLTKNPVSDNP